MFAAHKWTNLYCITCLSIRHTNYNSVLLKIIVFWQFLNTAKFISFNVFRLVLS